MECTVRDYATQNGVSDSIIYRHIRNHRQELDGLVIKRGRQTWITDAGQDFLRQLMTQRPLVLADGSSRDELNRLKAEVDRLKDALLAAQEVIIGHQALLAEAEQAKAALTASEALLSALEAERDSYKAQADKVVQEAQEMARELAQERSRPLSLKERLLGRKV